MHTNDLSLLLTRSSVQRVHLVGDIFTRNSYNVMTIIAIVTFECNAHFSRAAMQSRRLFHDMTHATRLPPCIASVPRILFIVFLLELIAESHLIIINLFPNVTIPMSCRNILHTEYDTFRRCNSLPFISLVLFSLL